MINITKPFLPPFEEYSRYLAGIWERNWLTNNGPLVNELELRLKEYLGAGHLLYMNNGTLALQIAFRALELKGEVITTPFSYVATTSSLVWEGLEPVFVDIDPETLNMDPRGIEAAITPRTSAILATHTYGNPCDMDAIGAIAARHGLRVIYDAAHCFGSLYKGKSVYTYGDISTASFHATKVFHTIEGGAVFTPDSELLKRMAWMRNFGHNGPDEFAEVGINGKNSEFHAAMGLVNLGHMGQILAGRKQRSEFYDFWMQHMRLGKVSGLPEGEGNHSYYPVIFESESALLKAVELLNAHWVYPRRYFYPSLSTLGYVSPRQELPICDDLSRRVLCLPLHDTLSKEEIDYVCRLILRAQNN